MMKAIVQDKYGSPDDVLQLREINKPVVGDDEVLVRVRAASVHPDVWHLVTGRPYVLSLMGAGVLKPKNPVPGTDMAGLVESVGKDVTRFGPGDEVFGETHTELQWRNGGAFAEYVSVPQDALALKPNGITFEQAAAVPTSGFIALHNLQSGGQIQPGQSVLSNGAGGGVGTIAVQLAKAYGACVTGVDSTEKMEMVRSLGADHVIDYTQEDFTQSGQQYDLILAANGYHPIADYKRALRPQGIYVCSGGSLAQIFQAGILGRLMSKTGGKQMGNLAHSQNHDDLVFVSELLGAGKIVPVVDRQYPLNELPEAFRYFGEGHARGKVIITVAHDDD